MTTPSDRIEAERPYAVDVFGIRERRPGEPEYTPMSREARWTRFEAQMRERDACRHVAACARAIRAIPHQGKQRRAA